MPINITTSRLCLSPRHIGELDACMMMDRDPLVTQYIEGPWQDPPQHKAFLLGRMQQDYARPFGYWSIYLNDKPQDFLGWIMLLPLDDDTQGAEIGWRLNRAAWGQGIGYEACTALIQTAFDDIPSLNITAYIHPENTGSLKLAQKLGMQAISPKSRKAMEDLIYSLSKS